MNLSKTVKDETFDDYFTEVDHSEAISTVRPGEMRLFYLNVRSGKIKISDLEKFTIENFIRSDVIVMDIDNDHSEVASDWVTPEKLEELFPNVEYLLAPSRHHFLDKEGKSARPRYHMYFPISEITDASGYASLKRAIQIAYSFFDGNALDAARFIFGAECDEVIFHEGWMTLDEEVEVSDIEEEDFDSEMPGGKSTGPILEGSRNNTMSRFAGRVLKRYGDTEKAHEAFLEIRVPTKQASWEEDEQRNERAFVLA